MNDLIRDLAQQAAAQADYYAMLSDAREKDIFVEKFAQLVMAAEREAIARMFDGKVWAYDYRCIAQRIRSRGEKNE